MAVINSAGSKETAHEAVLLLQHPRSSRDLAKRQRPVGCNLALRLPLVYILHKQPSVDQITALGIGEHIIEECLHILLIGSSGKYIDYIVIGLNGLSFSVFKLFSI